MLCSLWSSERLYILVYRISRPCIPLFVQAFMVIRQICLYALEIEVNEPKPRFCVPNYYRGCTSYTLAGHFNQSVYKVSYTYNTPTCVFGAVYSENIKAKRKYSSLLLPYFICIRQTEIYGTGKDRSEYLYGRTYIIFVIIVIMSAGRLCISCFLAKLMPVL